MGEVISIDDEVVKLKELSLLSAEVNDQSRIYEILKSVIHSFEEFIHKPKGKEVYSSSKLMSDVTDSMMKPRLDMLFGDTSFSTLKGEEEKKERKKDGKAFTIGVNKVVNKSKGKAKEICFY